MKVKQSVKSVLCLLAAVLLALVMRAGLTPPVSVSAEEITASSPSAVTTGAYDYNITEYRAEYTVYADRSISVTETITASFTGYNSHGIIRDLPLDHGVTYRNFSAACNSDDFSLSFSKDDSMFLSAYLRGEELVAGQSRTYTLSYKMLVPALEEEGYLPLDVVGYGWSAGMKNVLVTVSVPQAPLKTLVYSGYDGIMTNAYAEYEWQGNTLRITADALPVECGVTVDFSFAAGVLGTSFDYSWLAALAVAAVIAVLGVVFKVFLTRKPVFTATVNFTAPDEMDPLHMGKLIDNKVDSEDMGALVFWFAEKGYLTIDMSEDEKDPWLIRTDKELPADAPAYQKMLLEGLFAHASILEDPFSEGDPERHTRLRVRVGDLGVSFGNVARMAKESVPGVPQGMYTGRSNVLTVVLTLLAALVCGGFAFFWSMALVSSAFRYFVMLLAGIVAAVIPAFVSHIAAQRELKWGRGKCVTFRILSVMAGILLGMAVWYLMGYGTVTLSVASAFILLAAAAAGGTIAGTLVCRTKEYNDVLGQIVGFKNFILYTEKDKIKFMLNDDPELYYHILPYAQVLGVTDEWDDKFKGIDMPAPTYATGYANDAFSIILWSSMFRSFNMRMNHAVNIRPPSRSGIGKIGGGFGGGFGGGGFGGGGGRGC